MADEQNITEDHEWFTNTKKIIQFDLAATTEDISAWTVVWEFRKSATEDAYLIHKATGGDGVVIDGPGKKATLTIDAADTADLEPMKGAHALKRTDSAKPEVLTFGYAVLRQAAVH